MKRFLPFCTIVFLVFFSISLEASCPRPFIIILMGPPASGKGTQAARLTKELSIPAISTGELLRENRRNKTALGLKAEEFIDKGALVPDDMVLAMLFERIAQNDTKKGYLLDGFPRTVGQAKAYESHVGSSMQILVINIDTPDNVLFERIKERAKVEQRSDDTPAILEERLKNYRTQTAPLIQYFQTKKMLYVVDGLQPVDLITQRIEEIIASEKSKELALCETKS